jgi:RNA polymerase sigma-70 factor (ECF subfamily)
MEVFSRNSGCFGASNDQNDRQVSWRRRVIVTTAAVFGNDAALGDHRSRGAGILAGRLGGRPGRLFLRGLEPSPPAQAAGGGSGIEALVHHAKRGDQQAFAELMRLHQEQVVRLAFRLVGDKAEALDIAQEVFVAAYERLPFWDPRAQFSTWLFRVTANVSVDHLRRRARRRKAEQESARLRRVEAEGEASAPGEELKSRVARAIDRLPERQRAVLSLHFLEGFPEAETAEILGITVNNVRVTLHKAIARVRRTVRAGGE